MDVFQTNPPVFEKRLPQQRHQVRFWCRPEIYRQFVQEVEKNDLVVSEVFNQFMRWFSESSARGVLPKRPTVAQGS